MIDEKFAYLAGLWKADRCSTAKGIVGIRSKDSELLTHVSEILENYFDKAKLRKRDIKTGFSPTSEVYVCSCVLRRRIEALINERNSVFDKRDDATASFLAGLFDGDGSASFEKRTLYFAYGLRDEKEVLQDRKMIENLGFYCSITKAGRGMRLNVLKPTDFARFIYHFVFLERKKLQLSDFSNPKAERARPLRTVANFPSGGGALCADCPC